VWFHYAQKAAGLCFQTGGYLVRIMKGSRLKMMKSADNHFLGRHSDTLRLNSENLHDKIPRIAIHQPSRLPLSWIGIKVINRIELEQNVSFAE
jgi:hypothetical protein